MEEVSIVLGVTHNSSLIPVLFRNLEFFGVMLCYVVSLHSFSSLYPSLNFSSLAPKQHPTFVFDECLIASFPI